MKKIFTLFALFLFFAGKIFSLEFSLGGNLGTIVQQHENSSGATTLIGLPQLGATADLRFEKFGLQFDFGFAWTNENFFYDTTDELESKSKSCMETITISPYFPFDIGKFSISIGFVFGFTFSQGKLEIPDQKYEYVLYSYGIVTGGAIAVKYRLSDNFKLFFQFPVITTPYTEITEVDDNKKTEFKTPKGSWLPSKLSVIPALGLMYTF